MTPTRRTRSRRLVAMTLAFVLASGVAWAYWSAGSVPGGYGASAATSVNQGATPSASAVGTTVTVTWAPSTLATGGAVNGYQIKRYDAVTSTVQPILSACTGTITALTCTENSVPPGSWRYAVVPVFATNWQGAESARSSPVLVAALDLTPPTNAISLSEITGGAAKTADTVYYRGTVAGSFTLTNAVSDAGSGPASSATAALSGTPTGWTHTPSTVSTPSGGPYVSSRFSWAAATASAPTEVVTGRDVAGNAAATTVSFVNDAAAPTSTVTYPDGFQAGRSVPVTFTSADSGSGVATGQLQRRSAPLTAGTCGSYSGFANLGPVNPTSPYTDSQVTNGICYQYRYVVSDRVGNQSASTNPNVARVDYDGAVSATAGLLSHWRLGESAASLVSSDSFTDPAGTLLSAHTGGGTTWTRWVNDTITVFATNANRMRRDSIVGPVAYHSSTLPSSADYRVEADVVVKSITTGDTIAVIGRWDIAATTTPSTSPGTYYTAQYQATTGQWQLIKRVGTVNSTLGTFAQTLAPGSTYRVGLDMSGTTIRLFVDGVQRVTAIDTTITTAGRAGVRLGASSQNPPQSDTQGVHLDNFQVTPSTYPRAADSKGTNTGDHVNGVTLAQPGAHAGDPNTAARFDGVNDYVRAVSTTGIPVGASARSVETWFKTTSSARQVLFSYGAAASAQQFGLSLNAGGTTMTASGSGAGNDKVFTLPAAVNDGSWHHVVKTYNGTAITLYIDGVALALQAATRATVMAPSGFVIGAVTDSADPNTGGYFNGTLDEVSLYTTALSQATVTNHYQLGTSPEPDVTGPTGGSVGASGLVGTGSRYATSTVLSLDLAKGTDPSGVAATGAQLLRATAPLTSGTCSTYGAYTLVPGGTDAVSPKADTVADQACYRYQYVVSDTVGNSSTYNSADVKVDLTAPAAPTLGFSAFTNTAVTGSTVYYRSAASSGAFTVTAAATDTASGIATYAFPALGAGWTSTPGALGLNTYSWAGTPAAPGTRNVTATNNAAATSPNAPFTPTADDLAPGAGTVSYLDGTTTSTSISVSFTTGTDAGSGLGTRLLQRASATRTGSSCGTFGAFVTVAGGTDPTSPHVDTGSGENCYRYQYVVSDKVGNQHTATSPSVVKLSMTYVDTINATVGLLSYWRLGETAASLVSSDSFTGAAGTALTSHTGEVGASWLHQTGAATARISNANRVYRTGLLGAFCVDYTTATPPSPDYSVAADLFVASNLAGDMTGVVGRLNTATNSFYLATWDQASSRWALMEYTSGNGAILGAAAAPTLTASRTYRVRLTMTGAQLQLYVNGVLTVSATDTTLAAAGKAGIRDADSSILPLVSKTDTTGVHFDNFQVTPSTYPRIVDSNGTNAGDYANGVTLGQPGALTGDSNTAAQFDGVNDVGSVARQVSTDFSAEFWFKSTQGIGTSATWYRGAALVDNTATLANQNDWGVSLRSDGRLVAGVGSPDTSIVSTTAGYNNGAWHHVVFTRAATGAIVLHVDGSQVASGIGGTAARNSVAVITFGRHAESGGNAYAGFLDEISLYSTVLPSATVTAHYNAGR